MKKTIAILFVVLFAMGGYAQNADDICGIFFSRDPFSKEGSQCEIYKAKDGDRPRSELRIVEAEFIVNNK